MHSQNSFDQTSFDCAIFLPIPRLFVDLTLGERISTVTNQLNLTEFFVELLPFISRKRQRGRSQIFIKVFRVGGARNRSNVLAAREHPTENKLSRRATALLCPFRYQVYEWHIGLERFGGEHRQCGASIVLGESGVFVNLSEREGAAQRAVGDKTNAKFSKRREDLGFRFAPPNSVFRLNGRKWRDCMRAANATSRSFRQALVQNLAFLD